MDRSTDFEVVKSAVDWLMSSPVIYLVTVASTWGSSPRRPGSLMAINPDGRFTGSVSGGCIEDDLVRQVMQGNLDDGCPRIVEYGVTRDDIQRVGLACGGRITLLVERIESAGQLQTLLQKIDQGQLVNRHVCLATGEASLRPVRTERELEFDGRDLFKVFGPGWRLVLTGAGELSQRVAQLALTLDYAVSVCDSRPEYVENWTNRQQDMEGVQLVTANIAEAMTTLAPDSRTAVLALAHTPALDDPALIHALQSPAFYVGALGSQKNQQARIKRLQQTELNAEQIARLHAPVGLDIGSHTPAEIAIAIIAALVQERNRSVNADHRINSVCA